MSTARQVDPGCCQCDFPDIPAHWLLFVDFAFTFGTTVVYFADIVTDIITLQMYLERGWHFAFGLSLFFVVAPSILVSVLEYNFLQTYGKNVSWKTLLFRTVLNVPFQLTVIWYHCQLTYTFFKSWLDHLRGVPAKSNATSTAKWYEPTTLERSRGASLSSLNELDFHNSLINQKAVDINQSSDLRNCSGSLGFLTVKERGSSTKLKSSWWKRLTREQWLSHLNKLKLTESMLESLPQLLINLYLIIYHADTVAIQYISAVLSYLSLCGGVVRYDKTKKDNEADRWMVDRTLLHSRAFYTRLEWPQLLFISIYKGSFLAARSLAIVYFTIYLTWYIIIPILIHWSVLLIYLVYKWYPDFSKVTRQLSQADNKYRAYYFLSRDFMSVLMESLIGIFIHVRPYFHALLDQPYCFMFWYYLAYVIENITLFILPGIVHSINKNDEQLELYRYYPLLAIQLVLNVIGALFCSVYYVAVHKTKAYTAHAYPSGSLTLCFCCYPRRLEDDVMYWLPVRKGWTVCKQVETSELFFLRKDQLVIFQQMYSTVVRNDRRRGRAIECFVDDRCRIFYAPRSKMEKISMKTPSAETLRPSYKKLMDAHARSLAAGEGLGASVDDTRKRESNKSDNELLQQKGSSAWRLHDADDRLDEESLNNLAEESENLVTSPTEIAGGRPKRKPRVKSLRGANPNRILSRELVSWEPRTDEPSSFSPVPLPRKIDDNAAAANFPVTSDGEITYPKKQRSIPSPEVLSTLSKHHCDVDDSTYKVQKHFKKGKSVSPNPDHGQETLDAKSSQSENPTLLETGEIAFDVTGWTQTWI